MSVAYDTPLPRVQGRHQNRALAARRRARCVDLAAAGWSYEAIRAELGYANRGTVWRIVNKALVAHEASSVADLRRVQLTRLEALLSSAWTAAAEGDVEAITACVRIVEAEVKLMALRADATPCRQPQTVVLLEDDCRLRGCPQHT